MDIQITRTGGRWEVRVDGVVFSTHNEPKEGYENLIEQTHLNPDKVVEMVPNFKVVATVTGVSDEVPLTLTDAEIENYVKTLPIFEPGNSYQYVLFELDNDGVKNVSDIKDVEM